MTVDQAQSGRRFGPYELLEVLGQGGSAVVYRARDARPDAPARTVAVKLIATAFAASPEFRARFRQEAALVRRLRHRHVLAVFDSGESGPDGPGTDLVDATRLDLATGYAYLVTEYCAGGALDVVMRRTRSTRERCRLALEVATQIGSAIDAAHQAGVLHRDVKPSNILVAADGRLVLGDFGLARALQDGPGQYLTLTGHVTGTPAYMAPEQASGDPADTRTDLYSLAVVLYEIVTGSVPFRAETAMAVMLAHVHQPPPRATDLAPGVPPTVSDVLVRALAKRQDARFPTGDALATALHHALVAVSRGAPVTGVVPAQNGAPRGRAEVRPVDETWPGEPVAFDGGARVPRTKRRRSWFTRLPLAVRIAGVVATAAVVSTGVLAIGGLLSDGATGLAGIGLALTNLPGRVLTAIDSWQASDEPPIVTEALLPAAGGPAPLRASLTLRFSTPMNTATVEKSLRFEPLVALDFEWNGQLVVVTPRVDLAPGTEYVISLGTDALDRDGRPLARPIVHRFTTRTITDATASPSVRTALSDRAVPGDVTATVVRTSTPRPAPTSMTRPTGAPTVRPSATAGASPRSFGTLAMPGATPASRDVTIPSPRPMRPDATTTPVTMASPSFPVAPAMPTPAGTERSTSLSGPTVTPAVFAGAPTASPIPTAPTGPALIVVPGATLATSPTVIGPRVVPTMPPTAVAYPTPPPPRPAPTLTVAVVWTPTAGFFVIIPTVAIFPSPTAGAFSSPTAARTPTRVPFVVGTVTTADAPSP
jgi:serine/threonine-protein kinase